MEENVRGLRYSPVFVEFGVKMIYFPSVQGSVVIAKYINATATCIAQKFWYLSAQCRYILFSLQ